MANVSPIFKKGSRFSAANYRPVSLTSVLCKVMEKFVKRAITQHLLKNGLLSPAQHGFVKQRGCVTNLIESLDNITQGNNVLIILLDFAKAFDKVSHRRLIHKLRAYGISGKLLKWIENFLLDRKQRVLLGDNESDWSNVQSGVPQGSVLGPLLFIIFINDMPDNIRSKILLYADDSKLISILNGDNTLTLTQSEIDQLVSWANLWLMELILDKCKVMPFGDLSPTLLTMNDKNNTPHPIETTLCERDLGVTVSANLKWHEHCSIISARANRVLGMLGRTFMCRDPRVWKMLYISLVRPHLEFASSVWNPTHLCDIRQLESVQRRATKMARGFRKLDYGQRLKLLELTTLEVNNTK